MLYVFPPQAGEGEGEGGEYRGRISLCCETLSTALENRKSPSLGSDGSGKHQEKRFSGENYERSDSMA